MKNYSLFLALSLLTLPIFAHEHKSTNKEQKTIKKAGVSITKIAIGIASLAGSYCTYKRTLHHINVWQKSSDELGLADAFTEISRQWGFTSSKEHNKLKKHILFERIKKAEPIIGWSIVTFVLFVNGVVELADGIGLINFLENYSKSEDSI